MLLTSGRDCTFHRIFYVQNLKLQNNVGIDLHFSDISTSYAVFPELNPFMYHWKQDRLVQYVEASPIIDRFRAYRLPSL